MKIGSIINEINNSNCYIVGNEKTGKCLIIDPASRGQNSIHSFLKKEKFVSDYIILTHSHFDHIAGVEYLISNGKPKIIASSLCSEKIVDPIRNLSFFSDLGPIASPKADILIENLANGEIDWDGIKINFFNTPGHSRCSICIKIENNLFVGDTIIKNSPTKITHPDGNRDELNQSIKFIYETIPNTTLVLPGHGKSFILNTHDTQHH